MDLMKNALEVAFWNSIVGDNQDEPFESVISRRFKIITGAGYSTMFHLSTISAVCGWSSQNGFCPVALYFTIPNPSDYFEQAGFFGGIVVSGRDDPIEVEKFLGRDGPGGLPLSVYDASHRFIVTPEDGSWLLIGDRDADLALYGFKNEDVRASLLGLHELPMFDSLKDAARYAKDFMNYDLQMDWIDR